MPTRQPLVSRFVLVAVMATSLIGTRSTAQSDSNERLVTRMDSAQIALTSKTKLKSLDRHLVPELEVAGTEIVGAGQQISVRYLARAAGRGAPAGSGITGKGKVQVTFNCVSAAGTETLAKQTLKFGKFGNAFTQFNATPTAPCAKLRVVRKFKGSMAVESGGTVIEKLTVTPLEPLAARRMDPCSQGASTLCFGLKDRFKAIIDWRDFEGGTKQGAVIREARGTGLFYLFSPDNWEMLVKVIDGCSVNDHFWVFYASATNVEYTLTVTDTVTGQTHSYDNQLGTTAASVADTTAFATCP